MTATARDQLQDTIEQAAHAVENSASAFALWSGLPATERAEILAAMAGELDKQRDAFIDISARELGASSEWVEFNLSLSQSILRQASKSLPHLAEQSLGPDQHGIESKVQRAPCGVVLSIAPWNAPIVLATRAIAAPLLCGNTVVLKGSEHCPQTHALLVNTFNRAGLPEGVLNYVSNPPEYADAVVNHLIAHPSVRRVNFTGSTRVGREIAVTAARHLKRCVLALSGKAPLIVLDDADIERAVTAACYGGFFNQGQICMSTDSVIVVESIAEQFVAQLTLKAQELKAADPMHESQALGRVINADAANRVSALVEDAVRHGASCLVGGEVSGAVVQPVVLDHVSSLMRVYHEESFAPLLCILRVHDEDEAASIANDTKYGLAAAVFSRDLPRAHQFADRLETGIVQINGPTVFDNPNMPFGGVKESGYGRQGWLTAYEEFTELRWIADHSQQAIPDICSR